MAADAVAATVGSLRPAEARRASAGLWSDALWRLRHDPTTLIALAVIVAMVAVAIAADLLAENFFHKGFGEQSILDNYTKPSGAQPWLWLGTDELGRSQVVRLLYGARVSLFIGSFGALTAFAIGLTMGLTAGYFRGPDPSTPKHTGMFGAPQRPSTRILARVLKIGKVPAISDNDRRQMIADLRYWRASVVVLSPKRRNADALREATTDLLGFAPTTIGGAWVWDVRTVVGSSGNSITS